MYTASETERENAINKLGFEDEGEQCFVFTADPSGVTSFYRLAKRGAHFYTTSLYERDFAIARVGFTSEDIACLVLPVAAAGAVPL